MNTRVPWGALVIAAVVAAVPGCEEQGERRGRQREASLPRTGPATADERVPKFQAELVCTNVRHGPSSDARARFETQGRMVCGHPGAVSEIRWWFRGHRNGKDVYRVERRFPLDSPQEMTSVKDIKFAGQELVVFEDDAQRIVLLPASR